MFAPHIWGYDADGGMCTAWACRNATHMGMVPHAHIGRRVSGMKPASFEYHAPASVDEALALLQQHASDVRLLAGGQSLVPMMNFPLVAPAVTGHLNRLPEPAYIEHEGAVVRIGAIT